MVPSSNSQPPWSPKLEMWAADALAECNLRTDTDRKVAIFPSWWIEKIEALHQPKIIDFNFIGALRTDQLTEKNRQWVLDFAKKFFTESSYLQFTDVITRKTHKPIGPFDNTLTRNGFVPKEHPVHNRGYFDHFYYEVLCKSKYTLCPAGDSKWSMRFYEAIACKSIPITTDNDPFRTVHEKKIGYFFFKRNTIAAYSRNQVDNNYNKFIDNQTFCHTHLMEL